MRLAPAPWMGDVELHHLHMGPRNATVEARVWSGGGRAPCGRAVAYDELDPVQAGRVSGLHGFRLPVHGRDTLGISAIWTNWFVRSSQSASAPGRRTIAAARRRRPPRSPGRRRGGDRDWTCFLDVNEL